MILLLDMLITLKCISLGFLFNFLLNLASLRHINFQLEFRPNILSQLKEGHNKFSTGFIDLLQTKLCIVSIVSLLEFVPCHLPLSLSLSLSLYDAILLQSFMFIICFFLPFVALDL